MAASPEDNRKDVSARLRSIERRLTALDGNAKEEERRRASRGVALVRAAQPPDGARRAPIPGSGSSGAGRPSAPSRPGVPGARTGTETGGSAAKANPLGNLSRLFSPKGIEESMNTIGNLRDFCKQAARYVQQADSLLDSLFATGTSLKESGILQKLAESKGKMSTTDLTNILLALMNSPIGNTFFKRLGGGSHEENGAASDAAAGGPQPGEPTGIPQRQRVRRPSARRRPKPQKGGSANRIIRGKKENGGRPANPGAGNGRMQRQPAAAAGSRGRAAGNRV